MRLTLFFLFLCVALRGIGSAQGDTLADAFTPPEEFRGKFGDYRSVLTFNDGRKVTSPQEWHQRRSEIFADWNKLLGDWPPLISAPPVEILETVERENFTQKKIRFDWIPGVPTEGYLLVPNGATENTPAVLTVYYEPETAIGLGKEDRDFALQLTRKGFVTLSIGTTEATENKTYSLYWPSIDDVKVQPLSMLAYAAANAAKVLAAQPEVDDTRIGIMGHSFGGKWALFAGCLSDQFAAVAVSDPGIVFADRPSVNYWEPWYLGWHPRPWRKRGVITDENPAHGLYKELIAEGRDLHELHALLAPRPFLVSGGSEDPPSQWIPLNHLIEVNRLLGYENRVAMTNRPEHAPNPESNAVIVEFFEHFLMETSE